MAFNDPLLDDIDEGDDLFEDQWQNFADDIVQEQAKPKKMSRREKREAKKAARQQAQVRPQSEAPAQVQRGASWRFFRFLLWLTTIFGVYLIVFLAASAAGKLDAKLLNDADAWFNDSRVVAILYETELSAATIDCTRFRDNPNYTVPAIPEWAAEQEVANENWTELYELMQSVQERLTSARNRIVGLCGPEATRDNSAWPPNTSPLPQIQATLNDAEKAQKIIRDLR